MLAISFKYSGSLTGLSSTGACSLTGWTGTSATFSPCQKSSIFPVPVTSPITATSNSHFSKISIMACSHPFLAQISIRSCDSDNIKSYGVIPSSRAGTLSKCIIIPEPLRPAISKELEVSPAAPISWIPMIKSFLNNSKHASKRSFSVNGSPTCTVGLLLSLSSVNEAEDITAPPSPSRPVLDPTYITGFPKPSAFP